MIPLNKEDLEKVAQLWCLPQHANKEMDVDFARSIVGLLYAERAATLELKEVKDLMIAVNNLPMECDCPNHARFNKHACPCTLRKLELKDALEAFAKMKADLR